MSEHQRYKVLHLMWKGIQLVVSPSKASPNEDVAREYDMRSHLGWTKPLIECGLNSYQFKKEREIDLPYDASCRILEDMVREVLADNFKAYIASPESSGTDKMNYLKSQLAEYAAKPAETKKHATVKELLGTASKTPAEIKQMVGEIDDLDATLARVDREQQERVSEIEGDPADFEDEDVTGWVPVASTADPLPSAPETDAAPEAEHVAG